MQDTGSSPGFLGSGLFRGIAVTIFLAIVGLAFAFNPGGAARETVEVRIAASLEVVDWVKAAATDFNSISPSITVVVDSFSDSNSALNAASRSFGAPNPYAAAIIKQQMEPLGTDIFSTEPELTSQPVASSPIIAVIRGEYLAPLSEVTGHSNPTIADFVFLYDPNMPADSPVRSVGGGMPMWGAVNSGDYDGPAAVYALASGLQGAAQPDFADQSLVPRLKPLYDASPQGRPSFQLVADDMAKFGPTGPAAAVLPEAIALRTGQSLNQRGQMLHLIYPQYAVQERFEMGIIATGPTDRQREAAAKFRDYLISPAGKATAASFGLRASDGSVDTSSGDSLWQKLGQIGAQPDYKPGQVVEPTSEDWSRATQLLQTLRVK